MTALRQRYIRDLAIRGKAKGTQVLYTFYMVELARYYRKSPDLLSYDQVADWLYHLLRERKLSTSAVSVAVCAIRFFYGVTLRRPGPNATPSERTPTRSRRSKPF
jgi:hypothetical protein